MTRPLRSTDPIRIGDYELTGRIGGGGMGDVFLGRSPGGRSAAVKVVRDLLADDPRFRERFRREVAAARSVSGAYTAAVLDADPDAERPWLATAYIDGPSLLARVSDGGPMDAQEARALGAGLAEALRDIHRAGLVHRDLKPGNVLLAADGPRLIDFGIIRAEDGEGLTETGYVLGSAGYMAPEQAAGGEATAAADVYSLGAVLTFAATGHGPFGDGPTPGVLLRQAAGDRDIAAVPEGLRDVVARCLDAVPGTRPTTNALLELLGGNAIATEQVSSGKDGKKTARTKTRTKDRTRTPELDDLLRGASSNTQNAEIAATPTTLMRSESGKGAKNAKNAKNARNTKSAQGRPRPKPEPIPTRRKFLFFGLTGAAVAAFGVGVADMPHGDSKTTGAESDDKAPKSATELPTVKMPGLIGGPAKNPAWFNTITNADFLALSGTTLLVKGTTLSAFDTSTGARHWAAANGTFSQLYDGVLPATVDTVYEAAPTGGDLLAIEVGTGAQAWSVPGPASWLTRGLVGASADVVVVWSYIDKAQPDSDGLWGVDPTSRRLLWNAKIGTAFEGSPHFSAGTGLILLSQPNSHQLTAYNAKTGEHAWTAKDNTPNDDPAFATAIASAGTSIYWAASRLYAFDANGKPRWPVGATPAGTDGLFHAVIADETTVYAASVGSLEEQSFIAAYQASDGAPLWLTSWPKNFHDPSLECELALGGGNLYIVDHYSGTLVSLNAKTGETNWQFHDPGASPNDDWTVVADDKNVFIGYDSTVRGFVA